MDALTTGILVSDDQRLVLRPYPVLMRRRQLLGVAGVMLADAAILASVALALFRPHLGVAPVIAVALAGTCAILYRSSTKVTYIALRDADGIYVETRNRLLRHTRRRLLHRYADITAVELRSRVNPNALLPGASPTGAFTHYDVVLRKGTRTAIFWYTRYPDCAQQIAERVAEFANVPVSARDAR